MDPEVQQEIRELRQLVERLQGQLNDQAAVALAQPAPQVPVPVEFGTSPASVRLNQVIDYTSTQGMKLYKQATEALPIKHDLDQEKLTLFLGSLASRAEIQGWDKQLLIINQNGQDLNLIENYGTIKLESVRQHVMNYAFQETRQAQDAINLFNCLEHSLTDDALITMQAEKDTYTLKRRDIPLAHVNFGANPEETTRDGVLFLWMIINRTTARTNATISVIIEKLNNLPSLISELNHDITEFNTKVRGLINSYYVNKGEKYDNEVLLQSLFKAYKNTSDNKFNEWIERKETDHEDGTKLLNAEELLEAAMKQYQTRVQKKLWGEDSMEKKEIINLSAKLVVSANKLEKLERSIQRNKNRFMNRSKPFRRFNKFNKFKNNNRNKRLTPAQFRQQRYNNAPAWMKQKPDNINKQIIRRGKTYYWCDKHHLWQCHRTKDCQVDNLPNIPSTITETTIATDPNNGNNNFVPAPIKQEQEPISLMAIQDMEEDY